MPPAALPAGWTTSAIGSGVPFVTQASLAHTTPNALFVPEQETQGQSFRPSGRPSLSRLRARLTFRHRCARTTRKTSTAARWKSRSTAASSSTPKTSARCSSAARYGGSIARVTDCDAERAAPYGWVNNVGSGGTGTSAVNIVLPNAMAGHDVAFRWRHGSDCSVKEEGGGWWINS